MPNDLDNFLMCFKKSAASMVDRHYFSVHSEGSYGLVYRERVYCYELYHKIRSNLSDFPLDQYRLNGEYIKSGHPKMKKCKGKMPDFIFHQPDDMDRNLVVIEVKHKANVDKDELRKDIESLELFLRHEPGHGRYEHGIELVYGLGQCPDDTFSYLSDLINDITNLSIRDRITLLWHPGPGQPLEHKFGYCIPVRSIIEAHD